MSKGKIESSIGNTPDTAATTGWIVGPGKPPIEYRFRKGQSGNPAGRPRRSGAPGQRLRGADEPMRQVILEEAYSMVTVRQGDSEIEMPMNQAIFRAIGMAALAGSQVAQRRWAEMVRAAEAEQKRAQIAIYNVTEREDKAWEARERKRQWARGEEVDESYDPYAEDIIVDMGSQEVVIRVDEDGEET